MTPTPPSHICGPKLTRAARDDRDRWVASLPSSMKPERIGALLGISRNAVVRAYPLRAAPKIPVAILPPTATPVSLPAVPGVGVTRARPEADPRAGIITPRRYYDPAAGAVVHRGTHRGHPPDVDQHEGRSMKRWEVTLIVRGETIKHVVKSDDFDGAVARASRAHNGKIVVAGVKRLEERE